MTKLNSIIATVAFLVAVGGLSTGPGAGTIRSEPIEPDYAIILKGYKKWTRVNSMPFRMSPAVAALCAAPIAGRASSHTTPDSYVDVYVNPAGREAMFTPAPLHFPEGTIIVKEKRKGGGETDPELLTVMLKRSRGYNADTGDWDFAVLDGKATSVQAEGKLENCMQCHKTAAASDYVFRPYLPAQR